MAENKKNVKKGKANSEVTSKTTSKNVKPKNTKVSSKTSNNKKNTKIVQKSTSDESLKKSVLKDDLKTNKNNKEKKENLNASRRQLYYNNNNETDEFSKLLKIVLIVTAIIVVFYGVTVVVTKKAEEAAKEAQKEETKIQYDSIMIGSMLNINGNFYVLIEDNDDIRLNEYTVMIQTIKANDDAPTIYTASLDSGFNKNYLSDETNYESNMEKFRVKGTTLVKIEDHKIADVYDNYDDIIKKLKELD